MKPKRQLTSEPGPDLRFSAQSPGQTRGYILSVLLVLGQVLTGEGRADLAEGLDAAAKRDWPKALAAFSGAAERGNSNAQVNLGNLYLHGLGVPQNDQAAFLWYERAALQGNAIAEAKLAVLYYHGLGTPENRPRAAEWFQKAGDQGDPHAALVLAEMKLSGDGIPQNRVEAYLWFSIAEELGHEEAVQPRATVAEALSAADIRQALDRLSLWREGYQQRLEKAARRTRPTATTHPPEASADSRTGPSKERHQLTKAKGSKKKKKTGLRPEPPAPGG